jgi:hypothetical protein
MAYEQSKSIQGIGAQLTIGPNVSVTGTADYVPVFEITDQPFKPAEWDKLDVTNFNSLGNAKEFRKGLIDYGTVSLTGNAVGDDPGQIAMAAAFADKKSAYLFQLTMPLGVDQTATGDVYSFAALVLSWTPLASLAPTKTVEFKAELQITGPVTKTAGA